METEPIRFILASQSSGRLRALRQAGLDPEVMVSGFDEDQIIDPDSAALSAQLARAKGEVVVGRVHSDAIVVACDSVLEFEGRPNGKPGNADAVIEQWRRMRGGRGVLHTGHHVWVRRAGRESSALRVASTEVRFADLADDEIEAYVATGEPVHVAGAFTIDGLGGAYITAVAGDPHNVIGISLPLLRQILLDLGISWHSLWRPEVRGH